MKPKYLFTFCLSFFNYFSLSAESGIDDFFRSTGKINTVLAVVIILFLVLIFFLVRLESKMNKLEKQNEK